MGPPVRSRLLATTRRNGVRVAVWVLAVLVVSAGGLGLYFAMGLHGSEPSIEAVRSAEEVSVTHEDGVYALEPVGENATVGLVFYPGGRVDPDAYLAALAPLVGQADVAVYVPEMPLNLAVLDPSAANRIIAHHPDIDRWIVGGHSLGGAMACRYADQRSERVVGVVLFAAYCDVDVSSEGLPVLSVTGGADTVLDREVYRQNRENLPTNATVVDIPRMNHTQFGSYSGQRGDQPARIGYKEAHRRLASVVVPWIENRTSEPTREIEPPRDDGDEKEKRSRVGSKDGTSDHPWWTATCARWD